MYCSEPFIKEFHRRICSVADTITDSYEIIFVNDGSPDASLEIALDIQKRDSRIRIIGIELGVLNAQIPYRINGRHRNRPGDEF